MSENVYRIIKSNGEEYVEFITNGKYHAIVKVDKDIWFNYLINFSWTAIKRGKRTEIKTSINKQSKVLHRVIIEKIYDELDYWGSTIGHKNNDNLDNREKNLKVFNTALLNSTNINSKNKINDMQYIYPQKRKLNDGSDYIYGYKVHYNIGGKTYYENFHSKEEAKNYRDKIVYEHREEELKKLLKKCRDIEFERGLRDKIKASEESDIREILKKYRIL